MSLEAKPGGLILLPTRTKILCRWCGAAYEMRPDENDEKATEGVRAHELQCRAAVRQRFVQAALSGQIAGKGGEAIVDTVESVMAQIDAQPRSTWKETL